MDIPIKDNVQQVFAKNDTDSDGLINKNQIITAAQDLKIQLSQFEVNKMFQHLDLDNDNKIDFETFYEWLVAKNQGTVKLLYFKLKAVKVLKGISNKLQKIFQNKQFKGQGQFQNHHLGISFGDAPDKSQIGIQLLIGNDALQHQSEYAKYVKINESLPNLVIRLKSKNPSKQLDLLKEVIEQGKVLVVEFLPEVIQDKVISQIQFDYGVSQDSVYIVVTYDYPLVQQIIEAYFSELKPYLGNMMSGIIKLCIGVGINGYDLINQNQTNLIDLISSGFNANLDLQISSEIMHLIREFYYQKVEKIITSGKISYQFKDSKHFLPLLLLQSSYVQFKQKKINSNDNPILQQIPIQTFSQLEQIAAAQQQADLKQIIAQFPIFEQLKEAMSYSEERFEFTLQLPGLALNFFGSGDGMDSVLNKLIKFN